MGSRIVVVVMTEAVALDVILPLLVVVEVAVVVVGVAVVVVDVCKDGRERRVMEASRSEVVEVEEDESEDPWTTTEEGDGFVILEGRKQKNAWGK